MQQPLDAWQEGMERHFAELARSRSIKALPVFALEHGLSQAEFQEISKVLKSRLKNGISPAEHWLLWVIYATEFGYIYEGHEYWISFEEQTPGWSSLQRAAQLASWFKKFQKTFSGVTPSGPWARHFHRIALPITNAILPKYLQRQFAQAIYNLRYDLMRLDLTDAQSAGRLLASSAWSASTRFQEFLQQEELAGRILLALLDECSSGQSPIFDATLQRIITDLETVHEAKEWLRATRHHVSDHFKGLGRDSRIISRTSDGGEPGINDALPKLKPRFLLRRDSQTSWVPILEVPDFVEIAKLNPLLMTFLRKTRVRVNGASDAWLPGGWTLNGPQHRVLKTWPNDGVPLLTFEAENPVLKVMLDTDFRFAPNARWLLRISSDGMAREIESGIVRPGDQYILLGRTPFAHGNPLLTDCIISCEGVVAAHLSAPSAFSDADIDALRGLGLQAGQSVRIWPVGLMARLWDGEGHCEWLTTESPCFAIMHDHPVDAYEVRVGGNKIASFNASSPGTPLYLRLSPLPPGTHRLDVSAIRTGAAAENRPGGELSGFMELDIRDPKPWVPGTAHHSGLVVSIDPPNPTLEDFWQGEVGISVLGPEGHQVSCAIALTNKSAESVLSEQIAAFELPMNAHAWTTRFLKFVGDEKKAWAYLDAVAGRFTLRTEELGQYVLELERSRTPIRWLCRDSARATSVRLLDDTGEEAAPVSAHYSFRRPAQAIPVGPDTLLHAQDVPDAGGLYYAQQGEHRDTLVVSTRQVEGGFQGLLIAANLIDLKSASIESSLEIIDLWNISRLLGPFAAQRRDNVVNAIRNDLYGKICGERWQRAESVYLSHQDSASALQELDHAIGLQTASGFPLVIRRDWQSIEPRLASVADWFVSLAERYQVTDDKELCRFAFMLANQPTGLRAQYQDRLQVLLSSLQGNPVVLRSARLLALQVVSRSDSSGMRWT